MESWIRGYPDCRTIYIVRIIEALKPRSTNIDEMLDNVRRDGYIGVFGEGTRLAMPKKILRAGLIVIEAWFRGY